MSREQRNLLQTLYRIGGTVALLLSTLMLLVVFIRISATDNRVAVLAQSYTQSDSVLKKIASTMVLRKEFDSLKANAATKHEVDSTVRLAMKKMNSQTFSSAAGGKDYSRLIAHIVFLEMRGGRQAMTLWQCPRDGNEDENGFVKTLKVWKCNKCGTKYPAPKLKK